MNVSDSSRSQFVTRVLMAINQFEYDRAQEMRAFRATQSAPSGTPAAWELTFEQLADLPLDTVVISANNRRWLIGASRDNLRALIPVPRWPVEHGDQPNWLYFYRHGDDIEALGPWRLAFEPRQVDAQELSAELVGTVVLDRAGRAWQRHNPDSNLRVLICVTGETIGLNTRTCQRADETHGPFTIIHTPSPTGEPTE